MTFIYPQFSDFELPGVRLAGPGLGNLLLIYFRAWLAAREHGYDFIWPTWPSIKPGAILRREKDKRFYGDLFRNRSGYTDGLKKQLLIHRRGAIRVNERDYDFSQVGDGQVILYSYFHMDFQDLVPHADEIREEIVRNLSRKSARGLEGDMSRCVNIHVRLGDFGKNQNALNAGKDNMRIGIGWYAATVRKLKAILGDGIVFNIFSDGSDEELKELLAIDGTRRVFYGNSLADILALSRAPLMIASGSSFSLWARFLGQCSSISYPNQIKDRVLKPGASGFEIECAEDGELPEAVKETVRALYAL
ncbi:MAG: alpha-1,2-fucosyltransferase [Eubacteriales bacterium]|nr:alpha-1,2-fucosyltransferase [Eubacteriales bacterium]